MAQQYRIVAKQAQHVDKKAEHCVAFWFQQVGIGKKELREQLQIGQAIADPDAFDLLLQFLCQDRVHGRPLAFSTGGVGLIASSFGGVGAEVDFGPQLV